jgi:hypothetical protein
MSTELMVGAKELFIAVIVSIALVLVFFGGIDSDFWLVAVATCYYPDGGFSAFSWLLAAQVFHSTQEDH